MWLSGCNHDDPASALTDQKTLVASTSPQDGATDVPTSRPVVIVFNTSMDEQSVMEYFHCAGGDEMWAWMDSLQSHHTGIGGHMTDMDHMMAWMKDFQLAMRRAHDSFSNRVLNA
jgi:hypothetical protein